MAIATDFAAQRLVDEEIAAEIKRHHEHIKVLKIRRNSFCAVNQLPNDVLTHVFHFVKLRAEASSADGVFSPRAYSRWTVLLRVCHAWRELIINTPSFWSTINLNSSNAWGMLALSKCALLRIDVRVRDTTTERRWALLHDIISQGHRLQEVSMACPDITALSRILNSIPVSSCAPHLQTLSVVVGNGMGQVSGALWSELPALRSLTLFGAPLPSNTCSMPNLTHLQIGQQYSGQHVTVSWLLSVLKSLPKIREVDVSNLHGPSVHPNSMPVTLPCLQHLRLGSNDLSTLIILDNLFTPLSSTLAIHYEGVPADTLKITEFSSFRSTISRIVSTAISVDSVAISFLGTFKLTVGLRYDLCDPPPQIPSFHCSFPLVPDAELQVFSQFCEVLPLGETPLLSLSGLTTSNVHSFIPSAPKIKTLILENCHPQVLRLLTETSKASIAPNPELGCIRFQRTYFPKMRCKNGISAILRNILFERKLQKIPIKIIYLHGCEIMDDQVKYLRGLVEVVRFW